MKSEKILIGILAGAAVGAALGLLFAPDKGSVSRQQISDKGEDLWETLKSKYEDILSFVSEETNEAKNKTEELYAKGKEKVQEAKVI